MIDIFEESARLREAAKQRLDIPLLGTEWSAPQCAFFGAVVPGQENHFRVVWFDVKRSRLRFEMLDGSLLFSGGVTEKAVCVFVEKFWYWTKDKA